MKDIKIDNWLIKTQYIISWIGFILFGLIFVWLIAIVLYSYGKDTPDNKQKKKGLLNMTYQKFIFIYGSIFGDLFTIALIIDLIQMIFTGKPM
jgi:hypothetical protein